MPTQIPFGAGPVLRLWRRQGGVEGEGDGRFGRNDRTPAACRQVAPGVQARPRAVCQRCCVSVSLVAANGSTRAMVERSSGVVPVRGRRTLRIDNRRAGPPGVPVRDCSTLPVRPRLVQALENARPGLAMEAHVPELWRAPQHG
jgi:hypothetical protein